MKHQKLQKFLKGDVVHITDKLPSSMSHFRCGCDAIIVGCYRELCPGHGGDDKVDDWDVRFYDGGGSAWYQTDQLTFIRPGGKEEFAMLGLPWRGP